MSGRLNRRLVAMVLIVAGLALAAVTILRPGDADDADDGAVRSEAARSQAAQGEAAQNGPSSADPDAVQGEEAEADSDPSAESSAELEARFKRVVASMWWHLDRFEKLRLTQAQLEQMDALCFEMLRRRQRLRQAVRSLQPAWRQALGQLDMGEASRRQQELRNALAALAMAEDELVLDVLELLRDEQLEILKRDHPAILQRPWFRTLKATRDGRDGRPAAGGGANERAPAR